VNYERHYNQLLQEVAGPLNQLQQAVLKHEVDKYRHKIAENLRTDVQDWINAVCKHYQLEPEALAIKSRKRELVVPRQIVMWGLLMGVVPNNLGPSAVGVLFNKDHATAIHCKKVINQLCDCDPIVRENIMMLVSVFGWQTSWDPSTRKFTMHHDAFTLKTAA